MVTRDNRGDKNPMYGKHHSNESRKRISDSKIGCTSWNEGNVFSKNHHHRICPICKIEFKNYSNKCCSKECASKLMKQMHTKTYTNCSYCGRNIIRKKSRIKKYANHYCNNECKNKHAGIIYTLDKNNNWKGGKSFEPYSIAFNKSLKDSIRKRDNYTCQICEYTSKQSGKTLCVHHIDYDKNNCNSNNLISLCRECHGKTNSNRNYWEWQLKIFMSL